MTTISVTLLMTWAIFYLYFFRLQHFPLYRESDTICEGPDAPPEAEKSIQHQVRKDVLSKEASDMVRLIELPFSSVGWCIVTLASSPISLTTQCKVYGICIYVSHYKIQSVRNMYHVLAGTNTCYQDPFTTMIVSH